ncbi:MAG: outer-membrane lipoprotein carrier protein LolA [Campylobacteraceae bacterium]|nr:outer-membrane lipoprotein carrier protein LolA [Campylobacteraceae bacterium]
MVYKLLLFVIITFSNLLALDELKEIKTFQADFTQTVTNESGKAISYNGKVFIKNNDRVLWKYISPIKKNVFLLNDIVVIDEPELEQVIYTKLKEELNILSILQGSKKLSKNRYESFFYNRKYELVINENKINEVSYKDELDNSIVIKFENVVQNEEIPEDFFRFIPPSHYDIIKK